MNDTPGTRIKRDNKKKTEISIEIPPEEEPEYPYENLGIIGENMQKWKKYFDWRKKSKKL